jgi:multidrug efflux pump subunit AcrA (membrane-fusion protein)
MTKSESNFSQIQNKANIELKAGKLIYDEISPIRLKKYFSILLLLLITVLLLPWTQNFSSAGKVTTMSQESRPQELTTVIPGKIVKWYVKEGDFVNKGDTIIKLAEIKDDYLDPNLLSRTSNMIDSENNAIQSYNSKNEAIKKQIEAAIAERNAKIKSIDNKLVQTYRKIDSDSLKWVAATNELKIAKRQLEGGEEMYSKDVIPLTELEKRRASFQNSEAKVTNAYNDFKNTQQDLVILNLEKISTNQLYADKIAKADGEFFSSQSLIAQGQGKVNKLQNQFSNYTIRSSQYFITAPQSGQISKIKYAGINEIVKEGEMIAQIVPILQDYVAEIFISPMDVQLLSKGQKVRLQFDGFPAIVFRGWPDQSYGIFSGKVAFIENNIQENGKYRVFIEPDESYKKMWPKSLRLGSGVNCFALLNDVPVYYELWRQINGFPPDFYSEKKSK